MQKILIYGDSNTWGDNFVTRTRIPDENQWPNILQDKLTGKVKIIQEGLPGRVAGDEEKDPQKIFKNGKTSFMSIFRTAAPVDTVIISLGTNDLQMKYNLPVQDILSSLLWYTDVIKEDYSDEENMEKYYVDKKMPNIIYILPANFIYEGELKEFGILDEHSEEKRQELIKLMKKKVSFIELDKLELFGDGLHYNHDDHKKVADKVHSYLIDNNLI